MSLKQMQILDGLTKPVMTISTESIWVDPSLAVDEAAKAVLASLETQIKNMVQMAVAAEREACAKLCDELSDKHTWEGCYADECAQAIRARGQA